MAEENPLEKLIPQVENYVETLKQFKSYVDLAKGKRFEEEDESEFLEVKSVIAQELELIMAMIEVENPSRAEVHKLITDISSLQYLSEQKENVLRSVETQWNKIFIGFQSILGQIKAAVRGAETPRVAQLEAYVETWKQFKSYVDMAKSKKFEEEDEIEFLEIKSVIAQELELIMASVEVENPSRDDVHKLITEISSLQFLSEQNENVVRNVETQWNKMFIGFQAILGQLKVLLKEEEKPKKKGWSFFGRKK